MFKRILNIGVISTNNEALNRKIRVSNLIAMITLVIMAGFFPLAISMKLILSIALLVFMSSVSVGSFFLHRRGLHTAAFFIYTISGYLYFISATITFGLVSNIHFFMLVMCMIAVAIFDNKTTIKIFIAASIIAFFSLRWFMKGKHGFIDLPPEMAGLEENVGTIILFLLFIITSIFFIFFKNENLKFQTDILIQKEIIEEKNKDITASITYAKRIQQSLLPTEKYISRTIRRLKREKE